MGGVGMYPKAQLSSCPVFAPLFVCQWGRSASTQDTGKHFLGGSSASHANAATQSPRNDVLPCRSVCTCMAHARQDTLDRPLPTFPAARDFACPAQQTFHGGRLGELANAAVLFSAHRRAQSKGKGRSGLNREGFLGQVILPLRGLVENLRPIIEPTGGHPDDGDDGDGGSGSSDKGSSGGGGNSNTDRGSGKHGKLGHDREGGDGDGNVRNDNNRSGGWRSLRHEVCGVFPAADRRGRVSAHGVTGRTSPHLRLRLRLSISLKVKKVSTRVRGVGNGDDSRGRRDGSRWSARRPAFVWANTAGRRRSDWR